MSFSLSGKKFIYYNKSNIYEYFTSSQICYFHSIRQSEHFTTALQSFIWHKGFWNLHIQLETVLVPIISLYSLHLQLFEEF